MQINHIFVWQTEGRHENNKNYLHSYLPVDSLGYQKDDLKINNSLGC